MLLELWPLSPVERLERLIASRMLGLVPWALGVEPGRRLIALHGALIVESQGNVTLAEAGHRPARKLLGELARGYRSRAELLRGVWNIGNFVPARHTATLHTAISRLRVALGAADWIVTHDDGYSLAPGVELLALDAEPTEPAHGAALRLEPPPDERQRVLAFIEQSGPASTADLARALRISGSTALRLVRQLVAEGLLERQGGGRSTRYQRTSP